MIVVKVAVGNECEAYIENRFSDGFNIISSDENNKGKTIVIQSMMFALGNEPAFPSSLDYRKYYHYVEFIENDKLYRLCRSQGGFVLRYLDKIVHFDTESEFKRYWRKNVSELPTIKKNNRTHIVDLSLLCQIFFVGQDKKDTSNLPVSRYFKKEDFLNMVSSFSGIDSCVPELRDIEELRKEIQGKKEKKEILLKRFNILKKQSASVSYIFSESDRLLFEKKLNSLDEAKKQMLELRKHRNQFITRKALWENTLKELTSLNRTIDFGQLRCLDCDSTKIAYVTSLKNGYTFDVSSKEMRQSIIASINDKIELYTEELGKLQIQIEECQIKIQQILKDDEVSLESLIFYKQEFCDAREAEKEIKEIRYQIDSLEAQINSIENSSEENKKKNKELFSKINEEISKFYKKIEPSGNQLIEGLFTRKSQVFSGSEATVFLLARLYALQQVLGHDFPIIVDSFRAEEVSSHKEMVIIELFKNIPNQKIFTATLKDEENGKYENLDGVNHVDFSSHKPSKLLSENFCPEFKTILSQLGITMSIEK